MINVKNRLTKNRAAAAPDHQQMNSPAQMRGGKPLLLLVLVFAQKLAGNAAAPASSDAFCAAKHVALASSACYSTFLNKWVIKSPMRGRRAEALGANADREGACMLPSAYPLGFCPRLC